MQVEQGSWATRSRLHRAALFATRSESAGAPVRSRPPPAARANHLLPATDGDLSVHLQLHCRHPLQSRRVHPGEDLPGCNTLPVQIPRHQVAVLDRRVRLTFDDVRGTLAQEDDYPRREDERARRCVLAIRVARFPPAPSLSRAVPCLERDRGGHPEDDRLGTAPRPDRIRVRTPPRPGCATPGRGGTDRPRVSRSPSLRQRRVPEPRCILARKPPTGFSALTRSSLAAVGCEGWWSAGLSGNHVAGGCSRPSASPVLVRG